MTDLLMTRDIEDNLDSNNSQKVLSARQGKVLLDTIKRLEEEVKALKETKTGGK